MDTDVRRHAGRRLGDAALSTPERIDWQDMDTAPKDGTEVMLRLVFPHGVAAYWDEELQRWVLSRPVHLESVSLPRGWAPK